MTHSLDTLAYQRAAVVLAGHWATDEVAAGARPASTAAARWTTIDRYDDRPPLRIPASATGVVGHDGGRVVVCIDEPDISTPARIEVIAPSADVARAQSLSTAPRHPGAVQHPLFGLMLRARSRRGGLSFDPMPFPVVSVADVHLPDGMWDHLLDQVEGALDRVEQLAGSPLAGSRGVLLHGPPGTGKTSICKALASRMAGRATIVFLTPDAETDLSVLYAALPALAPAVVFLEDIDTVARRRQRGTEGVLAEFLNALDGVGTSDGAIVTVMTTNDLAVLDAAARRAGRIDVVVEVGAPVLDARTSVLHAFLAHVPHDVDVAAVATASDGLTAADLREVTRAAVFAGSVPLSTDDLLRRVHQRREKGSRGMYL